MKFQFFFGRLQTDLCAHRDSVSHKFPHDPKNIRFLFSCHRYSFAISETKGCKFPFYLWRVWKQAAFPSSASPHFQSLTSWFALNKFHIWSKGGVDFSGLSIYNWLFRVVHWQKIFLGCPLTIDRLEGYHKSRILLFRLAQPVQS